MPNHILVTLDSDKFAEYVIAQIQNITRSSEAEVTLLWLFDTASSKNRSRIVDPLDWHMRKMEVETRLGIMVEVLTREGLSIKTAILEHSNAEQLIEYAQTHDVDLIMLTKQSKNVSNLVESVLKYTSIPVVIVPVSGFLLKDRTSVDSYQKILVPLDGSQRAEIILPIATSLAHDLNGELLLVHVVHKPDMPRHVPAKSEEIDLVERIVEINRADAAQYLENLAARLPGDVQTRLLISSNIAATLGRLVEHEDVDLVILSAHGYSGEPQHPYGNITSYFLTYSERAVLVVQDLPAASTYENNIPVFDRFDKAVTE
jgi:nucleotide-binding universal stress UspA family protein